MPRIPALRLPRFADALWQDLRFAARTLRKSPGFALAAILTLALAIGATTAIFTLLYTVMLRPLPVKNPGQLLLFQWHSNHKFRGSYGTSNFGYCDEAPGMWEPGAAAFWGCSFSSPMFDFLRSRATNFAGMIAMAGTGFKVKIGNSSSQESGQAVSGDFFQVLGVRPAFGRLLEPGDDAPGAANAIVLAYRYWMAAFGGSRSAVGHTMLLHDVPFTIVGVASPAFPGIVPGEGVAPNFWVTRVAVARASRAPPGRVPFEDASDMRLTIIGRLKPGVSRAQAQAEASLLFRDQIVHGAKLFEAQDNPRLVLLPAQSALTGEREEYATMLYLLSCGVGLILLITCANIGGLLLARSATRHKEMAVRLALGAGRGRVIRQLFTESVLLSVTGTLAGVLFAWWGTRALAGLLAGGSLRSFDFNLAPDARLLAFVASISILTGLLAGLAPAFRGTRVDLTSALKESSERAPGASSGSRWFTIGDGLVIAQIALAVVVLTGAGLFVRTLAKIRSINTGLDIRNLLLVSVRPQSLRYKPQQIRSLYDQLESEFAAIPGVISVSHSGAALLLGSSWQEALHLAAQPNRVLMLDCMSVGRHFFSTMRIPVLAGRTFTEADFASVTQYESKADSDAAAGSSPGHAGSAPAKSKQGSGAPIEVVVNQAFALAFFRNQSALGARLVPGGGYSFTNMNAPFLPYKQPWEVVGIVGDAKYDSLKAPVAPVVYVPSAGEDATFELRLARDPKPVISLARGILTRADRNLHSEIRTQTEAIDKQLRSERLSAKLSAAFAFLALLLACIGIYGLLAYEVARRTREVGIRMALGAQQRDILRLVLRQGAILALFGIGFGLAAAFALTRYLHSMLFEVTPTDPVTFAAVAALLVTTAIAACYLPARRAMRTDPLTAIRCE